MNDRDEMIQQETPLQEIPNAQAEPEKPQSNPRTRLYIVGGCLLIVVAVACVAALIYLGITLLGGKDPIAALVPNDSLVYVNVDLTKTQSDKFNNIIDIFQDIAEVAEKKTSTEALDKFMTDELGMNFAEDVMPWMGRYGSLVITGADMNSGDIDYMLILQTRSKAKADEFVPKLVTAMENKQSMNFDTSEKDGITLYTQTSGNLVIARAGNFVYFSNSEDSIIKSASLQKSDSLATSQSYKSAIAALNKGRLATIYFNADFYSEYLGSMGPGLMGSGATPLNELANSGLTSMAMGTSVENVGLRFDFAAIYDETQVSDFYKELLNTGYLEPKTDELIPADTFFFLGVNSSQSPAKYMQEGGPIYNPDIKESFDLLEKEYGISVTKLFELLSGEFAFAIGPADDGLFVELGQANLGITVLASTNDAAGFNDWFKGVLDVASKDMAVVYETNASAFGEYNLQELAIEDSGEKHTALFYGADKGYIILGSSSGILEDGLVRKNTLSTNTTYQETWKAFSSGSAPYMYLDVLGLLDFIKNSDPSLGMSDLGAAEKGLKKIPVIAMAMNKTSGYVQSQTLIVFMDTGK